MLYVVGIGPGKEDLLTLRAKDVLTSADVVLGHKTYVNRIKRLVKGQIIESKMGKELERVKLAVNLALEGKKVCLISGGDPTIYGMASLVFEYLTKNNIELEFRVIPGVTALSAASPLLGCPVSGDHCVISLSDLLTPWEVIEKRLIAALLGDFVIVVYNPSSRRRKKNLAKALEIILRFRGDVPIGCVKNAERDFTKVWVTKPSILKEELDRVDMHTILFVASHETESIDGKLLTPRGYSRKYSVFSDEACIFGGSGVTSGVTSVTISKRDRRDRDVEDESEFRVGRGEVKLGFEHELEGVGERRRGKGKGRGKEKERMEDRERNEKSSKEEQRKNKTNIAGIVAGAETDEGLKIAEASTSLAKEIVSSIKAFNPVEKFIAERCLVATADVSILSLLKFVRVEEVIKAVKNCSQIVVDVEMVKAGISGRLRKLSKNKDIFVASKVGLNCQSDETKTVVALGVEKLADKIDGQVFAVGNAPSALEELCRLIDRGVKPSAVIATPVGFTNAAKAKDELLKRDLPCIVVEGVRGGSTLCVAILNALFALADCC